jgi:hypothetical protein
VTRPGIDPGTVRLVAQPLNHYATPGPQKHYTLPKSKVNQSRYRTELAQKVGRGIALLFLDLDARRGWVVSTTPQPLYPRERPGTHCTGGWVGHRVGLDVCEKSHPPPGFDPRTVQPVASRYTD